MTRCAIFIAVLILAGCGNDRRRSVTDDGAVADTSVSIDSSPMSDSGDDATPFDSATPRDTGAPPIDSGTPPRDSGTPPRDSGTPPRDSGTPPDTSTPPDTGPPPTTIEDVQRGRVVEGTVVSFRDVIVTGVYSQGLWVQDPSLGPTYSGIRVYQGVTPTVSVSDRVDVSGTYIEYFGDTEIEFSTVTRRGAGTPIAPVSVTVAQAASEPYEGVLVRITDASTYLSFYDCTLDNPSCTDTDVWRVSSSGANLLVSDYTYESSDWLSRIGYLDITGVANYRYDNRRINPRTSADLRP